MLFFSSFTQLERFLQTDHFSHQTSSWSHDKILSHVDEKRVREHEFKSDAVIWWGSGSSASPSSMFDKLLHLSKFRNEKQWRCSQTPAEGKR